MKNTTTKYLRAIIVLIFLTIVIQSCFDYGYVDSKSFLGKWRLEGREVYNGMTIQIVNEDNKLKGYITSKPNNQYGATLMNDNDIWISKIERSANYYFKIKEKKIASDLFDTYDQDTYTIHYATFSEEKDTIFLSQKTPNRFTERTKIYYTRIN